MSVKFKILKFVIFVFLFWLPFLGNDCSRTDDTSIIGSWELVKMKGSTQDVCLGETVVFASSGTATLTCPNESSVQKSYTYSGNILTYTTNSVSYSVTFFVENALQKMKLTGRNGLDRELTYNRLSK